MWAQFFRALSDPVRLRLLEFLLTEDHTVSECVAHVGLSKGRVSTHLACLSDCGYVQVRREGRFAHHRVSAPRVADLVLLARSLAAVTTPQPWPPACASAMNPEHPTGRRGGILATIALILLPWCAAACRC